MQIEEAISLIHNLIVAEVDVVHSSLRPNGPSKTGLREEAKAAGKLFAALTGMKPTEEDLKNMVDL